MKKLGNLLRYSFLDLTARRSLWAILGVCALFTFQVRGCLGGNYQIDGRTLEGAAVAEYIGRIMFHGMAGGALFLAALLSMGILSRDKEDGTRTYMLSRAITRPQYLAGRLGAIALFATAIMLVLHGVIWLTLVFKAGIAPEGYMTASLLCGLNIVLIVLLTALLSLALPDWLAAILVLLVVVVSFFAEGFHAVMTSDMAAHVMPEGGLDVSVWLLMWPKIYGWQAFSSAITSGREFHYLGPVHPIWNILLYIAGVVGLLWWRFEREEI